MELGLSGLIVIRTVLVPTLRADSVSEAWARPSRPCRAVFLSCLNERVLPIQLFAKGGIQVVQTGESEIKFKTGLARRHTSTLWCTCCSIMPGESICISLSLGPYHYVQYSCLGIWLPLPRVRTRLQTHRQAAGSRSPPSQARALHGPRRRPLLCCSLFLSPCHIVCHAILAGCVLK